VGVAGTASPAARFFYHVTTAGNARRIRSQGLLPVMGPRSCKLQEQPAVHLFGERAAAEVAVMNWLGDEVSSRTRLVLLEVAVPLALHRQPDPQMPGVLLVYEPIPAAAVAATYPL